MILASGPRLGNPGTKTHFQRWLFPGEKQTMFPLSSQQHSGKRCFAGSLGDKIPMMRACNQNKKPEKSENTRGEKGEQIIKQLKRTDWDPLGYSAGVVLGTDR